MGWSEYPAAQITVPGDAGPNDPRIVIGGGDPALSILGQPAGIVFYWRAGKAFVLSVEDSGGTMGQLHLYVVENGALAAQILDVSYNELTTTASASFGVDVSLAPFGLLLRSAATFRATAGVAVPATPTEAVVTGLSQVIAVSATAKADVSVMLNVQAAAGSATAVFARLYVDGVLQAGEGADTLITAGVAMPNPQRWTVSGLAPGNHTFEVRVTKSNALGTYNIGITNSTMTVHLYW